MPVILLIRHGENDYVKTHRLAGRLPGVHLNQNGQKQAQALAEKLGAAPIKAVYSSPLDYGRWKRQLPLPRHWDRRFSRGTA